MQEILPGIRHWTAFRDTIGSRVSSYVIEPAGILLDPMVPEEGIDALEALPVRPQQVVLTNRHHGRHSSRIAAAFDIPIRVPALGMHEFADEPRARPYEDGDAVAPGVVAIEIGTLAPDEMVLHITHGDGALAFGDTLIRRAGALAFVPGGLMGPFPGRVRDGLRDAFRGLLDRDFDALLFAHGEPLAHGGEPALREFVAPDGGDPQRER